MNTVCRKTSCCKKAVTVHWGQKHGFCVPFNRGVVLGFSRKLALSFFTSMVEIVKAPAQSWKLSLPYSVSALGMWRQPGTQSKWTTLSTWMKLPLYLGWSPTCCSCFSQIQSWPWKFSLGPAPHTSTVCGAQGNGMGPGEPSWLRESGSWNPWRPGLLVRTITPPQGCLG